MSIRKLPSGRYQVRVRLGNGERAEPVLPAGATYRDAVELRTRLQARKIEVAKGLKPSRMIAEAIAKWEPEARALKSWDRDLRYRLDVIRERSAGKTLDDIPEVAEELKRDGLKAGLAPATINRHLAILRRLANLASNRWEWTDKPIGKRVHLLPGERQRDALLSPEHVLQLASEAGGDVEDVVIFAALTGLRKGELLELTPDRIQGAALILTAKTKSGKPRIVPLPPQALEIARRRLPWNVTGKQVRDAYERARAALDLNHVRFHDLRHAYGSWLGDSNAPPSDIRDLMGHSSLSVTSRYLHTKRAGLERSTALLPRLGVQVGNEGPKDEAA